MRSHLEAGWSIFWKRRDKTLLCTCKQTIIYWKISLLFYNYRRKNLASEDTKPHLQCCRPPSRSFSVEVVIQSVQEENMKLTPNGACKGPKQFWIFWNCFGRLPFWFFLSSSIWNFFCHIPSSWIVIRLNTEFGCVEAKKKWLTVLSKKHVWRTQAAWANFHSSRGTSA